MNFDFISEGPCLWEGRYPRAAGADSVFHLELDSSGEWRPSINWLTHEGRGTCWMIGDQSPRALAAAVNGVKRAMGGHSGGIFLVNEYGQVLVPAQDSNGRNGRRAYVGEVRGSMFFDDPFERIPSAVDFDDDGDYTIGDEWELPYVGAFYNLSAGDEIYYWPGHHPKQTAPETDYALISALRKVRRSGAVRFLVNPEGVVLTKVETGEWPRTTSTPVYVGRLNYDLWFEKEEPSC